MTQEEKRLAMIDQFAAMLTVDAGMALVLAESMRASGAHDSRISLRLDRVAVAAATLIASGLSSGDAALARRVLQQMRLQVLDEDGGAA